MMLPSLKTFDRQILQESLARISEKMFFFTKYSSAHSGALVVLATLAETNGK